MKKLVLILLLLLTLAASCALAAEAGETYYAYFPAGGWLRTEPKPNMPNVIRVPERVLLQLTQVNEKYAAATYKGKSGYIHTGEAVVLDYTDPDSPDAVSTEGFFAYEAYMRSSPVKNAPMTAKLPSDERFRITYVTDEYAAIDYDGERGYVYIGDFVPMEYARGEYEPYIAFSNEKIDLCVTPCYHSAVAKTLLPYTPLTVTGFDGDHLTVAYGGESFFIESGLLAPLEADFEVAAFEANLRGDVTLLRYPLANAETVAQVSRLEVVTVEAFYGEFARVRVGDTVGYIHYNRLAENSKTSEALGQLQAQIARIESQKILNIAFSLLEKDNPILYAYNTACGGNAVSTLEYGAPYLFAGSNISSLLKPRFASQNSHYYSTAKKYLGGFDCIGYIRYVHNSAGMKRLPAISAMKDEQDSLISVKNVPYDQWYTVLKVGDCIPIHHQGGGYHIMMYVGTLRDFGFTAEFLGELAPYIDYPLAIHCGMNNFHTRWYTTYIAERGLDVTPPDGGVMISIIGVPTSAAPYTETMWKGTSNQATFYWFDLAGYNLHVYTLDKWQKWYGIYRNTEK